MSEESPKLVTPARSRGAHRWLVLVIVGLAVFVAELDVTVVSIALPSIQRGLGVSAADLQWVVNAYLLFCGGFLLLAGRVVDRTGRKRMFIAGMVTFAVGTTLNALAPAVAVLVAGRALQGIATAMLLPTGLTTVTATFTEAKERARALGVWTAMQVASVSLGLILGGAITDALSWRWIFFINLPVAVVALIGAVWLLPADRGHGGEQSFDVGGALLVTGGLALLIYSLSEATNWGWVSARFLGLVSVAVVLLAGFVVVERRRSHPLVRLSIFRVPTVSVGNIGYLLVSAGMYGVFFFTSLYVQEILGYGPSLSGAALLPLTVGVIAGAGVAQPLIPRLGPPVLALVGAAVCATGMVLLVRTSVGSHYVSTLLPGLLVLALGLGLAMVPFTMLATTGVPDTETGLASGLYTTTGYLGGAVGLAVLSTLAATRTAHVRSGSVGRGPGTDLHALVAGYHLAYLTAACLLVATMPLVLLVRHRSTAQHDSLPSH